MKPAIAYLLCCGFLLSNTPAAETVSTAKKPNVIVIMADDFGYECVTANGGQSYKTPHLDRLAAAGIRFEHCHVQPLCTPTRVQLMTGRYNVRNYINFGTLLRNEVTFGQMFKQAGYATGVCGKWQLGREKDSAQHFGFDESLLWNHMRRPGRYANPGLERNGEELSFPLGSYGPTLVNDFAIDFVTRHKDKPFFLYYPMMLTHGPYQPTPDSQDWDPSAQGEKGDTGSFAEMVEYMDKMVGRLDTKLADLGIRDNTLLLFIGDNGTGRTVTSRFRGRELKGGKGTTTHLGTHVPLVVSWPGVSKGGRVLDDLISSVDLLPTICEAAQIKLAHTVDGVSFLPQLLGNRGTPRDSLYVWYSPRQNNKDLTVKEYAFNRNYKLYRTGEFYDLVQDSAENHPLEVDALTANQTTVRQALQKTLEQFTAARPLELDRQFRESKKADNN